MDHLIFLKLGGSLITDKNQARTPRPDVLARLATEIAAARAADPTLKLLLGHGSGSFGHTAAKKHRTREGVHGQAGWLGFAEVWREARALNQIVMESLAAAGLPVIVFPASAAILSSAGRPESVQVEPIQRALEAGLIPLVYGDTVFDRQLGGTIFSTEDIFSALAPILTPRRILLAGIDAGVYADFPICQNLIPHISGASFSSILASLSGSASIDVTGGMREKVDLMIQLTRQVSGLEASIFSGQIPGNLRAALDGHTPGTRITL